MHCGQSLPLQTPSVGDDPVKPPLTGPGFWEMFSRSTTSTAVSGDWDMGEMSSRLTTSTAISGFWDMGERLSQLTASASQDTCEDLSQFSGSSSGHCHRRFRATLRPPLLGDCTETTCAPFGNISRIRKGPLKGFASLCAGPDFKACISTNTWSPTAKLAFFTCLLCCVFCLFCTVTMQFCAISQAADIACFIIEA